MIYPIYDGKRGDHGHDGNDGNGYHNDEPLQPNAAKHFHREVPEGEKIGQ